MEPKKYWVVCQFDGGSTMVETEALDEAGAIRENFLSSNPRFQQEAVFTVFAAPLKRGTLEEIDAQG
jgi:hypothetical protein